MWRVRTCNCGPAGCVAGGLHCDAEAVVERKPAVTRSGGPAAGHAIDFTSLACPAWQIPELLQVVHG